MTQRFSMVLGWILLLVGIVRFFVEPPELLRTTFVQAVLYGIVGLYAIFFPRQHRTFVLWAGILGIGLAVLGFAGVEQITRYFQLTFVFNCCHAAIGITSLLFYLNPEKSKSSSSDTTRSAA